MNNKYPLDAAAKRMVSNIPVCRSYDTISTVKDYLFKAGQKLDTFNYIYVVDNKNILIGVVSLKDIFRKEEQEKIEYLMEKRIIKARPYTDKERIAVLAIRHNLKAIPIVDKDGKFLGVVPSDEILNILHEEHTEDLLRSAGIHRNNYSNKILESSARTLAKIRLPWLIVGLLGGIVAAKITIFFEGPLKSHFILASFIPLIVYMADAVGTQTQVLYIRNLALSEFPQKEYLKKEIRTSILISFVLSVLVFVFCFLAFSSLLIAFILGISLFLTIIAAMIIAILIPGLLYKLKKDPALGSGPFATIIADITSLVIYFLISSFLLGIFG